MDQVNAGLNAGMEKKAMPATASGWLNNRWTIALGGAMFMMTLGTIYSWSLFAQPLLACFGWSSTTVTWTFALAIFSLGTGAVVGGRWQDKVGPRKVALTGVLLWSLGNFLAGLGTAHFGAGWLYLTYGLVGGFGVGMGYVTPVAVVTKWFPERRGLAGGMVVMGFGLGAVIYNFVVKSIPSFAAAAQAAADYSAQVAAAHSTPNPAALVFAQHHVSAVLDVFLYSGIAFAVLAGACATLLKNPPAEFPGGTGAASSDALAHTTREILRTPPFYLLWVMLFLNVTAGILVIGNAVPMMQELTSLAPAIVAATYGGVALFNALGRFFWGAISDRIGSVRTFALIFGIQVVVRSEEHTSELQSLAYLVCRLLLEKKKKKTSLYAEAVTSTTAAAICSKLTLGNPRARVITSLSPTDIQVTWPRSPRIRRVRIQTYG